MSLQDSTAWLRCPNCFNDLSPAPEAGRLTIGCANGHRFDANRRGYVSLLPARSKIVGDDAAMLDARDALLGSGAYEPIRQSLVDALLRFVSEAGAGSEVVTYPDAPLRVLDSGCGTGYYLHGILDALAASGRSVRGLAADLSPAAVQRASHDRADVDGLVMDVHSPWPVRDAVADALTVVFAPRNPAEFARTLRPGGLLLVVVPQADHLEQLRALGGMLGIPDGKARALFESLSPWFSPVGEESVRYELGLTSDRARQLVEMGPSAHHVRENGAGHEAALPASVTVSVDVLAFTRA